MTDAPLFIIRPITTRDVEAAQALMRRTVEEDFRSTYDPDLHRDIDDIERTYMLPVRHTMLVAEDTRTGEIVGTAGARDGALHRGPDHLVRRYAGGTTAQLVRVYVRREDRRRGIARALVRAVLEFIVADGTYTIVALHTFPHSPGALAFWESIGTKVWEYEREGQFPQVFFEIPLDQVRELVRARAPGSGAG